MFGGDARVMHDNLPAGGVGEASARMDLRHPGSRLGHQATAPTDASDAQGDPRRARGREHQAADARADDRPPRRPRRLCGQHGGDARVPVGRGRQGVLRGERGEPTDTDVRVADI